MSSRSLKNNVTNKLFAYKLYIYIYVCVCGVCVCVCYIVQNTISTMR